MIYGYIRVSTKEQNTDRQYDAHTEYQIPEKNIFIDKQFGKGFTRKEYIKLMEIVQPGDLIVIKSIDRLGRNYDEILEQWHIITKEKNVDIFIIDMPLLDTRAKEKDITGIFVADLVLQILAYVAQTERKMILQRQREGIASAKARGVRFGRAKKKKPKTYEEIFEQWKAGKISAREAGRRLGVSHMTFLTWAKE